MFELGNISDAGNGTFGININRVSADKVNVPTQPSHPKNTVNDSAAAATIRYPVHGEIAGIRDGIHNAGTVISLTQTLQEVLADLSGQQVQIKGMAENLANGNSSESEKVGVQRVLRELIRNFNKTVEGIEYGGNRVFSGGKTISILVGNDTSVDIIAEDLRIDTGEAIAFVEPDVLLEKIGNNMEIIKGYNGFLLDVMEQVKDIVEKMQFELKGVFEAGSSAAEVHSTSQAGVLAHNKGEIEKVLENQVEVEPDKVLQLLRKEPEEDAGQKKDITKTPKLREEDGERTDAMKIAPLVEQQAAES